MAPKPIPAAGIIGEHALREAAATEFGQVMTLVRAAVSEKYSPPNSLAPVYCSIEAMYADRVIVEKAGRYYALAYTIGDDNKVTLSDEQEVVEQYLPVRMAEAAGNCFIEAKDAEGSVWEAVLIRSGLSHNGTFYPDAVLREAAPLFDGARVFAKADAEHLKGSGKDVNKLAGWISAPRFVEGKKADAGMVVGTLNLTAGVEALRSTIADAWKRGKRDLVGLSIDAYGKSGTAMRESKRVRVAKSLTKINSVDLIVEASAGGGLVRLVEAAADKENDEMKLKERMLEAIKTHLPEAYAKIDAETISDADLETRYAEALQAKADAAAAAAAAAAKPKGGQDDDQPLTRAEARMIEARAYARAQIAETKLPDAAKKKLRAQFEGLERFSEAQVDAAITAERDYLATITQSGRVQMGGLDIEVEDRSKAIDQMLEAFFDPAHKDHRNVRSFKECYVEMTGDRHVTGRIENCDRSRMAESLGAAFRESLDSTSFSNALGTSITRRMVAEFNAAVEFDGWRKICSVVPVNDFRTQDRVNIGGYGDLPTVNQGSPYLALTSPTDAKATYAVAKKGGTEDITLEMVKNDDVGAIRRIPVKLGRAAKRTLAKFVFDFIRTNPTIYDSVALFHASHGNLGSTALASAEVGVVRTAMMKQAERDSADRLGVGPAGLLVPIDLQETAWNIFQRGTNLDKTMIQSMMLEIIPVWYWTDTNDWAAYANPNDIPGLEVGFLDGQEEPQLFVQDMPNVGSMFSNDKITYKIRHIYGGTVVPDGYKAFYKEVV